MKLLGRSLTLLIRGTHRPDKVGTSLRATASRFRKPTAGRLPASDRPETWEETVEIADPHTFHTAWAERFNAGDADGMMELFEPDAVFVAQPGTPTTGEDSLNALKGLLQAGPPISVTTRHVYVAGDLALAIAEWAIKGTAADGSEMDLQGRTADVLRKGSQGWKLAIDNPFGTT